MIHNATPRFPLLAALILAMAVPAAAGTTTLYYPEKNGALFSISAPPDWEVTPIEEVGDFASLESPNGAILQFRAVTFDTAEEAMEEVDAIFDSTAEFLDEEFTAVKLDKPEKISGSLQGAKLTGSGKDKDGNDVQFLSAMIALGPTTVAEIWASVYPDDPDEAEQAAKILDSFEGLAE